jgi:polysaccharide export outer membrane protein
MTCSATNAASNGGDSVQPDLISFRLSDILKGDDAANPYLEPGDIISMPEAEQAFVVGNVFKPTPINLKEPVTVMRAIAMAGGIMPDTKLNRIRVIRQPQPGSAEQEIFVDLSAGQNHQKENIVLQPGDIVDVGTSGGKRFFRTLFSAFAPALASAPVRVIH